MLFFGVTPGAFQFYHFSLDSAILLLQNVSIEDSVKHPISFSSKQLLEQFHNQYINKRMETFQTSIELIEQSQKFYPLYFFVNKSKN